MGILLYPQQRALQSPGNEQAQNSRKFGQTVLLMIAITILAFNAGMFVGSRLDHSETKENMLQATESATSHGRFGKLTH